MISEVREGKIQGHPNEKETIQGARGADYNGMRIHSVAITRVNCSPASDVWLRRTNVNNPP